MVLEIIREAASLNIARDRKALKTKEKLTVIVKGHTNKKSSNLLNFNF